MRPLITEKQHVTLGLHLLAFLEAGGEERLCRVRMAFDRMEERWRTNSPEGTVLAFAIATAGATIATASLPINSELCEAVEVFRWGTVRTIVVLLVQYPEVAEFLRGIIDAPGL